MFGTLVPPLRAEDLGREVSPEEVGQACSYILRSDPGTLVSELEIRPQMRPPKA